METKFLFFLSNTENIDEFCKYHPTLRVPSWINCAQYYDCSMEDSIYKPYLHECPYPQLFSVATLQCEDFHQTSCGTRTEPMAPCKSYVLYKSSSYNLSVQYKTLSL